MADTFDPNLLRAAATSRTGNDFVDHLRMQSLRAMAAQDPDQSAYLESLLAPEQTKLDLHLEGGSVKGHKTKAIDLTEFVRHLTRAFSATARSIAGRTQWANEWQIEGLQPGSVRVVLQAPEPKSSKRDDAPIPGATPESPDSQAAKVVAQTMSMASDDSVELSDDDLVVDLPRVARHQLQLAMKVVNRSGWDISGELVQRGHTPSEMHLTGRGALRLVKALDGSDESRETKTVRGVLDGLKHSTNRAFVIPDHGPALSLECADDHLINIVGRLSSRPGTRVIATYDEISKLDASGEKMTNPTRILTAVEAADAMPAQEPLPVE